jgi:hypothetical protein
MGVQSVKLVERTFGEPSLASANNGSAAWIRGEVSPLDQKSATGWLADLYGGVQTGDDWARVNIPVYELHLTGFNSAMWSYYMAGTQTMGVNIVLWVHDPKDFDKRAEITQLGGHSGLEKAAGWNAHELDTTVTQFFFYGEGTTGTGLTAGTQYTLDQFKADIIFSTWTIYRITFEYGWEASGTFDHAYLADVKINGAMIYMRPDFSFFLKDELNRISDYLAKATAVYFVDPSAANDSGDGKTVYTAKKWTNSAVSLCTDGASDLIIRLPGNENIDDDDSDPAIVCDKTGITILGIGGGNPGQATEVNCSIRRRKSSGWAAAAGPAIEIQKPCSIIGLEVVASDQPGILISGEGGGTAGGFALIQHCRFVGWGLMTIGIQFDAGAYNRIDNCRFETLTSGVFLDSTASNNPDYNEFTNNKFYGCTYGIDTDTAMAPHNTRVIDNEFISSNTDTMTYSIQTRGLWDSGLITRNTIGLDTASAYDDSIANLKTDGIIITNNFYADS